MGCAPRAQDLHSAPVPAAVTGHLAGTQSFNCSVKGWDGIIESQNPMIGRDINRSSVHLSFLASFSLPNSPRLLLGELVLFYEVQYEYKGKSRRWPLSVETTETSQGLDMLSIKSWANIG